jgi:D-arginine dehydrogenase
MGAFDFIVVGGGMAGASAGYELAEVARVLIVEREAQPGYHTTGRSAALYSETYGNAVIRALTTGGKGFYRAPPEGFAAHPLLTPRGALFVGTAEQRPKLERHIEEAGSLVDSLRWFEAAEVAAMVPVLRPDYGVAGVYEPDAMDIDVHALHQGYLRGLRARGGSIVTGAEMLSATRRGDLWHIETTAGSFEAPVLVNAAGAWADVLGRLCGARAVGLVPKRRTALTFQPGPGLQTDHWPLVVEADETWYIKPDAGRLLLSPADETPSEPCDAQPEELDVATAIDRLERATTLKVGRIDSKWAGLRSFVKDKSPVVGFDPMVPGLFWLAGQGGYGIQTAPGMARLVAALAKGSPVPADLAALGVDAATVSPARFQTANEPA